MIEWFKKIHLLNLIMILLSLVAIISFIASGDVYSTIWAFNTLCWVIIASNLEIKNQDLKDQIDELYSRLRKKK